MDAASGDLNPQPSGRSQSAFREILSDAIRFWEPRRIAYNLILTAIVLAWVAFSWPHFLPAMRFESLVLMAVLAVLANICYCSAYLVDLAMQYFNFRRLWVRWRWSLWVFGMLFATLLANYWIADEIFPFVR